MKIIDTTLAIFFTLTLSFAAASSHEVFLAGNTYKLSLPYRTVRADDGEKMLFVSQAGYGVLRQDSPMETMVTVYCNPCVGIIVKSLDDTREYPLLMAHQDAWNKKSHLVNIIKRLKITKPHFTFFTKQMDVEEWNDGWKEDHGDKTQIDAFEETIAFYKTAFPDAAIISIFCPYRYERVGRYADIHHAIGVDKNGEIFSFAPLKAKLFDSENEEDIRLFFDKISTLYGMHRLASAFSVKSFIHCDFHKFKNRQKMLRHEGVGEVIKRQRRK